MKLTYKKIKDKPEVLISLTTLRREEFEALSEFFEQSWQGYIRQYTLEGKPRNRSASIRSNTTLRTAEDRLLFILYHLKGNAIQQLMGITFEMTQAQVSLWIKLLSKLLRDSLEKQGYLPKRKVEQLKKALEKESTVLLDATEREIQRPKDNEVQKEYYSGKKSVILSKIT
jgi:hypothetical protein